MATYPWIVPHEAHGQDLADFPNITRWFASIKSRPATVTVFAEASNAYPGKRPGDEERKVLFGQTTASAQR